MIEPEDFLYKYKIGSDTTIDVGEGDILLTKLLQEYAEKQVKNNVDLADVSQRNEQLALLRWMKNEPEFNIDDESEILDDYEYYKTNCG